MVSLQGGSRDHDRDDLSLGLLVIFELLFVGFVKPFQKVFDQLGRLLEVEIEVEYDADERDL